MSLFYCHQHHMTLLDEGWMDGWMDGRIRMWMDIQSVDCNIIFTVLYNTYMYVDGSLLLDVFLLLGSHHVSRCWLYGERFY